MPRYWTEEEVNDLNCMTDEEFIVKHPHRTLKAAMGKRSRIKNTRSDREIAHAYALENSEEILGLLGEANG